MSLSTWEICWSYFHAPALSLLMLPRPHMHSYSDEAPASFIFEKNWMPFVYWVSEGGREGV
jgi:hypothetical protein